ncbi:MAG: hypothetical protein AAFO06_17565, partial [Cyanobacteria bacterium J06597_16]
MTPDELQQAIENNASAIDRLTSAVDLLVSQFIRPNAQQALANHERIDQTEGIVLAIANTIDEMGKKLDQTVDLVDANVRARQAQDERFDAFNERFEETRALVAENASQLAQLKVLQDQNAEAMTVSLQETEALKMLTAQNAESLSVSRQETEALKELTAQNAEAIKAGYQETEALKELTAQNAEAIKAGYQETEALKELTA